MKIANGYHSSTRHSTVRFGYHSAKKRKRANIDIQQISRQTKISNKNLRLIEQLKFDALPPMPVKKAFILQYCKVVKNLTRL